MAKITLDTSEYESGLTQASDKTSNFSKSLSSIGSSVTSAGSKLTAGITVPVAALGAAVIKTGMDYEAGMSKVQAISGATGTEMDMLGDKAMEMAAKTKFSTADSAEAYTYMAMAGWKANDMVDGLTGIMNLAAASGENLGTTSDIVTDALTAFGLTAADSGRFADVLAAASNNANTNVSMLGESFKYVAPVAGAMGYSVEDMSVALGLMANSGIKASQAGTSLRTAITNMAKPTSSMVQVMDEYGIALTDADGNMLSFSEIMGVLREKMGGLDEATQASAAATLFGKEAMSGMLAIINAAPEDYNKLTEAINNSAGTTEKMAAIMQDNAAGAFERMKSAINVLFTQLSEHLLPAFTSIVEKVTAAVNWFGKLDSGTQKLILTIAGIAAAAGPVLIAIGKVITAIATISGALGSLGGVIGGIVKAVSGGITTILGIGGKLMTGIKALFALLMAHPVVAIVTAIIAAIVLLWNNCEAFRDAVKAIWDAIVGFFKAAAEGIKAAFDGVVDFFASVWQGIQDIFSAVADVLGGFFRDAWDVIQSVWSTVIEFFAGIWQGIQEIFSVVGEVLGNLFRAALEIIKAEWNGAVEFFTGIWEGIKAVFSTVKEVLSGFFSDAWAAIKEVWETAKDFFAGIGAGIHEVFSEVTAFIGNAFKAAWTIVKGAWDAAKEFFSGVWASIKEKGEAAASGVGEALKGAWEKAKTAWNNASSFFSGIKDKITSVFKNLVNSAKTWGKDMLSNFVSGISEKVGAVVNKVKSVAQTVRDYIGFSEPKKGPLSNFHTYAPDMMQLFADGIARNAGLVQRQFDKSLNFDFETRPLSFASNGISAGNAQSSAQTPFNGAGGTTVNIYSPVAVDAIQAAREWKKTTQRMAMGYV